MIIPNSLRLKILLTIIILTLMSLLFASTIILTETSTQTRNLTDLLLNIIAPTNVIAAAVEEGNPDSAINALTELKTNLSVTSAEIFGYDGSNFYSFSSANKKIPDILTKEKVSTQMRYSFDGAQLNLLFPIVKDGKLTGDIYVALNVGSTNSMRDLMELIVLICIICIFIAMRLEEMILNPLSYLVDAMRNVTTANDFSIRAVKKSNDEIGSLVDAFNSMLSSIQQNENLKLENQIAIELAKSSERATAEKSEFLAAMSHEIRTPLNGVLGMTQILMNSKLAPEQAEFVQTILLSGEALLSLINDILDFSKIEAGKVELDLIDYDIRSLIDDIIDITAMQAYKKNLEIYTIVDEKIPLIVNGDPYRLRQIILNLLSNATKFTQTGSLTLRVKLLSRHDDNITLQIEVEDTGIGMSPELLSQLFKPFSQGNSSITRKYGGTGLGLTISKRLIELMGGNIHVASSPGKGSTFDFTVSLKNSLKKPQQDSNDGVPELRSGNIKALCIDNNEIDRNNIINLCRTVGIECDSATGINDFLVTATKQDELYQLIFIDHQILNSEKPELLIKLKQTAATAKIVFITLLTAKSRNSNDIPADFNLSKPLRKSRFMNCIRTLFDNGNSISVNADDQRTNQAAQPAKILIAEDNQVNQQVMWNILKNAGYQADMVANGREAVNAQIKSTYDIILMDCEMPELDGYLASQEIRKHESTTKTHAIIIAMTANALKGDKEKCLAAGMDDYISKPVDIKIINEKIRFWVNKI